MANEATKEKLDIELEAPASFTSPEVLYQDLIQTIRRYHPSDDITMVEKAYKVATEAHKDQKRKSGEPYIIHPLCVAIILADLEMDKETIEAGLLHDVVEDTVMSLDDLTREFGSEVSFLVDGVTKLTQLNWDKDKVEIQAENLRKMFLAMAKDIRVIIIKLADRLHNMRTGQFWKPEKQKEKARETMEIYAPIADRLGISKIKIELDDLSLKFLKPEVYYDLVEKVHLKKDAREAFVQSIVDEVKRHMEEAGIHVEQRELKAYGDRLKVQIERLEKEIYRQVGEEFNINSPKQLGEILFDKMKLKGGKKTKTGYSTAADVLEKLAPDCPVVQMVLDYRQLTKLNSTYAEGLAAYIGADGRIHGKFNQTITATGRISSTEPNLQNIPVRMELGREIRKVFVAREGCTFVDADYSQIELRILAHMSGDERLIEAYREAQDIHAITASQVFHIPLDQVTPLQRRNAKAVNFGIVYGISAFGLSEGLSISRKEAMEYIEKYFETYPGVKKFLDGLVEQAKEQGYVSTLFGRRRPIPELNSPRTRAFGERVAMNSPIQGTAADIMKIAMVEVDRELRRRKLESRIVLQVHDELLVEAKESEAEEVVRILEDKMKHAADLKVSLEVEAKTGRSWFDAK